MWDWTFDKQAAFDGMTKRGINRIEMQFSGGNDEGGIDYTKATDLEGNEIVIEDTPWVSSFYENQTVTEGVWFPSYSEGGNLENQKFVPLSELDADLVDNINFRTNIESLIYSKYYTFAGEYYVEGTAILDVSENLAKITGSESHSTWSDIEEDY
jgi:hypothetical protein